MTAKPLSRSLIWAINPSFLSLTSLARFAIGSPVSRESTIGGRLSTTASSVSVGLYQHIIASAPKNSRTCMSRSKEFCR